MSNSDSSPKAIAEWEERLGVLIREYGQCMFRLGTVEALGDMSRLEWKAQEAKAAIITQVRQWLQDAPGSTGHPYRQCPTCRHFKRQDDPNRSHCDLLQTETHWMTWLNGCRRHEPVPETGKV